MFRNTLLVSFRNASKNAFFVVSNIIGMAIAMACCIMAYFYYDYNSSFDSIYENAGEIYRVNMLLTSENDETQYASVPLGLGNAVANNIEDIDKVIRYNRDGGSFRAEGDLFEMEIAFVDSSFFKVFDFDFIEGGGSLNNTSNIVISKSLEKKFFGEEPALGKVLEEVFEDGKVSSFIVTGVYEDLPANNSFENIAYANLYYQKSSKGDNWNEDDWEAITTLFVTLPQPSRKRAVLDQMNSFARNYNKDRTNFIISDFELEPFVEMSAKDNQNNPAAISTKPAFPGILITIIVGMGTFVLLITCFNLTNTSIANSTKRLKEIGLRKVMGSSKKALVFQFLGETLMICLMAFLLAIFLAKYLLIPGFNNLWPQGKLQVNFFESPWFLLFSFAVLIITSLLAGGYPAFYVSKFNPSVIFKGRQKFGGNNVVSYTFLSMQLIISLVSLISCVALIRNAKYQNDFDLGYNKDGLVFAYVDVYSHFEIFRNSLIQNPDIVSVAASQQHIGRHIGPSLVKSETKEIKARVMRVGDNYLKTAGLQIIEGRDFIDGSEEDKANSVIVSEEAVAKFGWKNPIGKTLTLMDSSQLNVIGVVKDVYNSSVWFELEPMIIHYGGNQNIGYILVSTDPSKVERVNKYMESKWKELFPDVLYYGKTMTKPHSEALRVNSNMLTMATFLGIVTVLLSSTGLFSLVVIKINLKLKEIGVRKVFGASFGNLVWIINNQFLKIFLISCFLGSAVAIVLVGNAMNSIWAYYQELNWITILASSGFLLACLIMSIASRLYRTIQINPITILREE